MLYTSAGTWHNIWSQQSLIYSYLDTYGIRSTLYSHVSMHRSSQSQIKSNSSNPKLAFYTHRNCLFWGWMRCSRQWIYISRKLKVVEYWSKATNDTSKSKLLSVVIHRSLVLQQRSNATNNTSKSKLLSVVIHPSLVLQQRSNATKNASKSKLLSVVTHRSLVLQQRPKTTNDTSKNKLLSVVTHRSPIWQQRKLWQQQGPPTTTKLQFSKINNRFSCTAFPNMCFYPYIIKSQFSEIHLEDAFPESTELYPKLFAKNIFLTV